MEEIGWSIFNGNIKGDEEGNTGGKRNTMIDYVVGSGDVKSKVDSDHLPVEVDNMKIGDRVDSDHHAVELLKGKYEGEEELEKGGMSRKRVWRGRWNEKKRKLFRERLGRMRQEEMELEKE